MSEGGRLRGGVVSEVGSCLRGVFSEGGSSPRWGCV